MVNSKPVPRISRVRRRFGRLAPRAVLRLLAALAILWGAANVLRATAARSIPNPSHPSLLSASLQPQPKLDRKRLDQLIKEEKFEEAAKETARLREEAKRTGDEPGWAWALIKEVQLRTALHGYETSVRFLKEEPWPKSSIQRDMLDLFYAQSLVTYYEAYSWEINQRERMEAKGPIDGRVNELNTQFASSAESVGEVRFG